MDHIANNVAVFDGGGVGLCSLILYVVCLLRTKFGGFASYQNCWVKSLFLYIDNRSDLVGFDVQSNERRCIGKQNNIWYNGLNK